MRSNVRAHVDTTAHFVLAQDFHQVATSAIKNLHSPGMSTRLYISLVILYFSSLTAHLLSWYAFYA